MSGFKQKSANVIEYRSGTQGCLVLFGLPFFGAGMMVTLMAVGVIPAEVNGPRIVFVLFGMVFVGVGLLMMLGRSGMIIDIAAGTVTKWFGLLVPMKKTVIPLEIFDTVGLWKKTMKNSRNTFFYYVQLEGEKALEQEVAMLQDYHQARAAQEELAKFLRFKVVDRTSGREVIREVDQLDESVAEKARREGIAVELTDPPPGMRSVVRVQDGSARIEIPPAGFGKIHYLKVAGPVFIALMILVIFLGPLIRMIAPEGYKLVAVIGGGVVVMSLAAGIGLLRSRKEAFRKWNITVTQGRLTVEQTGPGVDSSVTIPANELEEIEITQTRLPPNMEELESGKVRFKGTADNPAGQEFQAGPHMNQALNLLMALAPKPEMIARSDKASVNFGKGLDADELLYIKTLIVKTMAE